MAKSAASTVEEYLAELPEDRRQALSAVRDVVLRNLPEGYREMMTFGMIGYGIPLERYPNTYNGQPLAFAALAAQKNYNAFYLTCVNQDPEQERELREGFKAAGKKLDMGKSCIRFKRPDDLALDAIARIIATTPPERFIQQYEAAHGGH